MTDASPTTVHCSVLAPFWNTVLVHTSGLHAAFTLGEVLIVLGNQAVLDLSAHHHATVTLTTPIAWPLCLKRPPADFVQPRPAISRSPSLPDPARPPRELLFIEIGDG